MAIASREECLLRAAAIRPWAIEIGGPAGAGKTTLLKELGKRHKTIYADARLRRMTDLPRIVKNTMTFLPTYVRHARHSRWFTWTETRSMTYLRAWHDDLMQRPADSNEITLFDHGPIFRLVILREFGPKLTKTPRFLTWWNSVLQRWASALTMVAWLDAPDEVLLQRVRERPRWHRFKDTTDAEAYEFMKSYRESCEQVIGQLTAAGGPLVMRFDTTEMPTTTVADTVLSVLHGTDLPEPTSSVLRVSKAK